MNNAAKAAYFDRIAEKWDEWENLPMLAAKLDEGLEELGINPSEAILDVGCGTGNLTQALLPRLSSKGRIVAVDIAARMIEEAKRKIKDPRVEWRLADIRYLSLPDSSFDRVFCFSVWAHLGDPASVVGVLARLLKSGGHLHIWHFISREKIVEVHASAGEPIYHDVLDPAAKTAALLEKHGFRVTALIDNADRYLVTAVREARVRGQK